MKRRTCLNFTKTNSSIFMLMSIRIRTNPNTCSCNYWRRNSAIFVLWGIRTSRSTDGAVPIFQIYYRLKKIIKKQRLLCLSKTTVRQSVFYKRQTASFKRKKIQLYKAGNEQDEAQYVVRTIQKLMKDEDYKLDDFAILYRTNAQSRVMEDVLVKSNMNYQIVGGTKFYDRKEIKDLLAYLRLIANNDDDLSLARIINEPKRAIGATSFDKMLVYAMERDRSIFDAMGELVF